VTLSDEGSSNSNPWVNHISSAWTSHCPFLGTCCLFAFEFLILGALEATARSFNLIARLVASPLLWWMFSLVGQLCHPSIGLHLHHERCDGGNRSHANVESRFGSILPRLGEGIEVLDDQLTAIKLRVGTVTILDRFVLVGKHLSPLSDLALLGLPQMIEAFQLQLVVLFCSVSSQVIQDELFECTSCRNSL
jgi:hypothetical protein